MAPPSEPGNNLVGLQQVKDWVGILQTNTDSDSLIQLLVSSFSQYVINRTGRASFNSVSEYIDTLDGNGNSRIFVRNPPIVDLIQATAGSFVFPVSTTNATSGIFVEDSGKSIAFRSQWGTGYPANYPPASIYPYYFPPGVGNIQITYTGGYLAVPYDMQEICMEEIAILYARKDWKDLASKALAAGGGVTGTTQYRSWHLTPRSEAIIYYYSRYARS